MGQEVVIPSELHSGAEALGAIFAQLWFQQREFNDRVKQVEEQQDWFVHYALGASEEIHEILEDVQWKRHRRPIRLGVPVRDNLGLELADLTKYVISLWQEQGFSISDMLRYIDEKSEMVEHRFRQEHVTFAPNQPLLLVDLDGTLADFPLGFLAWLKGMARVEVPDPDYKTMSIEQLLGSPYHEYWVWKNRFEESGGYGRLPAFQDALDFVKARRSEGWGIIVTTARPTSIKRVWHDSFRWLREHDIEIDRLEMLGTDRVLLAERYKQAGHPLLALDDDPAISRRLADLCPVLMRNYPYNRDVFHHNIRHIWSLADELAKRTASWVSGEGDDPWQPTEEITSVSSI